MAPALLRAHPLREREQANRAGNDGSGQETTACTGGPLPGSALMRLAGVCFRVSPLGVGLADLVRALLFHRGFVELP
jgi:hypothetical protein